MNLHTVMGGRSKKRMKAIMTDELHKCEAYVKARQASPTVVQWFEIVPAAPDAKIWRKKNSMSGYWKAYNSTATPRVK